MRAGQLLEAESGWELNHLTQVGRRFGLTECRLRGSTRRRGMAATAKHLLHVGHRLRGKGPLTYRKGEDAK